MKKAPIIVAAIAGTLAVTGAVAPQLWRAPAPTVVAGIELHTTPDALQPDSGQAITAVPVNLSFDVKRVALGKRLFGDPKLSKDGTISCASCHDLNRGGSDGQRVSRGLGGAQGNVNSPTVLNSGLNFAQFWDGRAATLEEQIDGPLTHPKEMGTKWADVVDVLSADSSYREKFEAIYPDGVTKENVKDAIATYERSLVTPNSRFDRFLKGETTALTAEEKAGYDLFREVGCITCHQGVNLGGNSFQRFGVTSNYFVDRGEISEVDLGRFNVTGKERDKYKFKVPTLRNVSKTAPYLHDGSVDTLEEVVVIMTRYQLGQALDSREVALIVGFLRTLDGECAK